MHVEVAHSSLYNVEVGVGTQAQGVWLQGGWEQVHSTEQAA